MVKKPIFKILLVVLGLLILFFLFSLFTTGRVSNKTVSGLRWRNENWSGVIRIGADTKFLPWTTLTINPGTKILFEKRPDIEGTGWNKFADKYIKDHNDPTGRIGYARSHFEIVGRIKAIGTANNKIVFTSAQQNPEYADWDELVLLSGSRLEYVELSFAHNGANVFGKNVTIANSKIHDSLWSCIDIFSTGNKIENNEIFHCWHQGIGIKKDGPNIIEGNYVHDSQTSFNCENGARPNLKNNTYKAAYFVPECPKGENNIEKPGTPDTAGGTYSSQLIYPSSQ